ncbi:MAG: Gfo/Idh/MocA family oxidoreductase [Fibrobacteria bacterium]|nr:Gfo/Idh/MocA family oxidoreductase [Fibrobacteria bacterium]
MSDQLSAIVIGLGNIGLGLDINSKLEQVYSHTKAFMAHPSFQLVAGIDSNLDKQKSFTDFSGKPSFSSIKDWFSFWGKPIDIAVIAVPTNLHCKVLKEVLNFPVHNILMEKPLASNLDDADAIKQLIQKKNVGCAVNYIRRFDPCTRKIKEMLLTGELAGPLCGHTFYAKGLLVNASHYIDLFHFWFGKEENVSIIPSHKSDKNEQLPDFIIHYPDFNISFLAGDESAYSIGELEILFKTGKIRFSEFCRLLEYEIPGKSMLFSGYQNLIKADFPIAPDMDRYQYNVLDELYKSIISHKPFLSDIHSAYITLETCCKILEESKI